MAEKTKEFKRKLKSIGLSDEVVRAAWPVWWSEDAERSPSALNDLKFSVARKLGIAPTSLFDEGEATFVWRGEAKFKGLRVQSQAERESLVAFGNSVARLILTSTVSSTHRLDHGSAAEIRLSLLNAGAPFVQLADLLALAWALGVPVVHLRVFPLRAKRMAAMTVRFGDRYAILLGRDSSYPAPLAFTVAHELGHIACGHLPNDTSLVDLQTTEEQQCESDTVNDDEELAADRFALTVLTGRPQPRVEPTRKPRNPAELANAVLKASLKEKIEPGTLALCYAYQTGEWVYVQAALKIIYSRGRAMWKDINKVAVPWLNQERLTPDNLDFLLAVLGLS